MTTEQELARRVVALEADLQVEKAKRESIEERRAWGWIVAVLMFLVLMAIGMARPADAKETHWVYRGLSEHIRECNDHRWFHDVGCKSFVDKDDERAAVYILKRRIQFGTPPWTSLFTRILQRPCAESSWNKEETGVP